MIKSIAPGEDRSLPENSYFVLFSQENEGKSPPIAALGRLLRRTKEPARIVSRFASRPSLFFIRSIRFR